MADASAMTKGYEGFSYTDNASAASLSWANALTARLTQDIGFSSATRDHTLQLTAYLRYAPQSASLRWSANEASQFLVGLRYLL